LAVTLSEFIPPGDHVTLYAPLTIGNHVDHQLAFATVLLVKARGWKVRYYEDYPYAEADGAVAAALAARDASHWKSSTVPLGKEDLEAKIQAIACYESQMGVLFGSVEAMPERVRDYATQVGGERLWMSD
jgi:LmbE family N-acetylglucosaminyl deacetylase